MNGQPPTFATVIKVASVNPVESRSSKMTVYDAVGNVVKDGIVAYPKASAGTANEAYFFWDASNKNNRLVGSGTYLAVLKVTETVTGQTKVSSQKIGVVR